MTQSNEPTIECKNQAIAEFLGWEFKEESPDWFMAYFEGRLMWADNKKGLNKILLEGFKFHGDWNKLMPVWYKFRDSKIDGETPAKLHTNYVARLAQDIAYGTKDEFHHNIHIAIQWFNQQAVNRIDKLSAEADQTCENIKETFNKMKGRKICSNCGIDYNENESHKCPE